MDNLKENEIIIEVQNLVNNIEHAKEETNIYCDLIKQLFLSASTQN